MSGVGFMQWLELDLGLGLWLSQGLDMDGSIYDICHLMNTYLRPWDSIP